VGVLSPGPWTLARDEVARRASTGFDEEECQRLPRMLKSRDVQQVVPLKTEGDTNEGNEGIAERPGCAWRRTARD
jgi:hypothetical protein